MKAAHISLRKKSPADSIPVFMNDGIEQFSISPAGSEIFAAYASITLCCLLCPEQQSLLRRHIL